MQLTTSEVIMNLTEDIETLLSYIKYAEDEGFSFPKGIELDIESINRDLETVYYDEYEDCELMEG